MPVASTPVMATLLPRETIGADELPAGWVIEDGRAIPWWYSKTGVIVKWSLFLGLSALLLLYVGIGYLHAKRRLRRGLAPLGYHRFLVHRPDLARVDARYAFPQGSARPYHPDAPYYGMQAMPPHPHPPPPPPMYDPNAPRPPVYDGPGAYAHGAYAPDAATKVDYSPWRAEHTYRPADDGAAAAAAAAGNGGEDYAPPPGPPPAAVTADHSGVGDRPPYRS